MALVRRLLAHGSPAPGRESSTRGYPTTRRSSTARGQPTGAELAGGVKPAAVTGREQRDCFLLAVDVARDNEPRVVHRRRTSGLDGQLRGGRAQTTSAMADAPITAGSASRGRSTASYRTIAQTLTPTPTMLITTKDSETGRRQGAWVVATAARGSASPAARA